MEVSNLPRKPNGLQKILAFGLMCVAGWYAVKLFNNYIFPTMTTFLEGFWLVLALGLPAFLIVMFVAKNPYFIWSFFTTISRKITDFWIKQDPLSVMDRYLEWLAKKLKNLGISIQVLVGKRDKLARKVDDLVDQREKVLELGKAAINQGSHLATNDPRKADYDRAAALNGSKAATLRNSIDLLTPMLNGANQAISKMQTIESNWKYSWEQTKFEVDMKKDEYETIKEIVKGLKNADDFINSGNEQARQFGVGLKALEETVTQGMGYVEEFDRKSKDMVFNISIEKQANQDKGLKELDDYIQQTNLTLPTSFEGSAGGQGAQVSEFNLLNKTN